MVSLFEGDCLEKMRLIPESSVDMILADMPYGYTKNIWDTPISLDKLWPEYLRVIKDNAAIVLFGYGVFSAKLILSNERFYKYSLVWKKGERGAGFLNAKKMPLRNHEDILVFYKKQPVYNPQFTIGKPCHSRGVQFKTKELTTNYNTHKQVETLKTNLKYPKSILDFEISRKRLHPTQKPVELLEYLIKTYTNDSAIVLDNCMGSGSTGVACIKTNRNFIGIEKDTHFFNIAQKRLEQAAKEAGEC